jgi:hypothetical protein
MKRLMLAIVHALPTISYFGQWRGESGRKSGGKMRSIAQKG